MRTSEERLRDHAHELLRLAENTREEEGRACLRSAAREWLRAADKLERFDLSAPRSLPNEERTG